MLSAENRMEPEVRETEMERKSVGGRGSGQGDRGIERRKRVME